MKLVEYPDRDMMMIDVANQLAGEIATQVMVNGAASLAVPGGTTPQPIFDVLCAADLDWGKITVLPTDERWVPEVDENSNARLIKEHLLVNRAAAAQFIPVFRDGVTPEESVEQLSRDLQPHLPISVLLLGMGADMHTASLFPGADGTERALDTHATGYLPVRQNGNGPVNMRMSLTLGVLNGAISRHLVITGAEKRAALTRAREIGDPAIAPVAGVLAGTTVHWAE